MPAALTAGAVLVTAIDRAVAVLPRLRQPRPIWGGSLAATRHALDILDLPNTIGRTLTEDLPIGDRATEAGLRVLTRRAIRPPTPLDGSFGDLWRFGRRQYQLIRLYRPGLWSLRRLDRHDRPDRAYPSVIDPPRLAARPAHHLSSALWARSRPRSGSPIGRKLGVADGIGFRVAQHILVWTILPAPVFHASVIWGGFITSPVIWRHVRYVVDKAGRVIAVARRPHSDQSV